MKQETLQLTGGSGKTKRRALDFYPTPPEATKALMNFLKLDPCVVWEPACGDGSMSKVIEGYGHTVISSDIASECAGLSNQDFLRDNSAPQHKVDAIITNPPFNLSEAFIRRALQIAPTVAMLLKSQYWHAKVRYPLFAQHPPAYILPLTWRPDFLFNTRKEGEKKGAPTMEVAWTVWITGDRSAKYQPLLKPKV